MRLSLIIFLSLFLNSTWAFQCLVVAGNNKDIDKNAVFANDPLLSKNPIVNKTPCKIFDGWNELFAFIQKQKIPKNEKLLIFQEAHGGPGGSAATNAGGSSSDQILEILEGLANNYQVGFINSSCFSGDLLKKKIVHDAVRSDLTSLSNLCIISDSFFGRTTTLSRDLSIFDRVANLEEYFLQGNGAMISAAGWDQIGITNYLMEKETEGALEILHDLDRLLSTPMAGCESACPKDDLPIFTQQILNGCVGDKMYESLFSFNGLRTVFDQEQYDYYYHLLAQRRKSNMPNEKKCLDKIIEIVRPPEKSSISRLDTIDFFPKLPPTTISYHLKLQTFFNSPTAETCKEYLTKDRREKQWGIEQDFLGHHAFLSPTSLLREIPDSLEDDFLLTFLPAFRKKWRSFNEARNYLLDRQLLKDDEYVDLAHVGNQLSRECAIEENKLVIRNLLGDYFFDFDYSLEGSPSGKHSSTLLPILTLFQKIAVTSDLSSHPRDKQRQDACRNFTFQ